MYSKSLILFFEEQIKAFGIDVMGKDIFPICGEFSPDMAEKIESRF